MGAALYGYVAYDNACNDYEDARNDCLDAVSGHEELWEDMNSKYKGAQDKEKVHTLTFSLAAGVNLRNLLDSVLF